MSNESESEEYMRYCVIKYKSSIQEEYKNWAKTDENFLAPDYELIVWGEECGQTQIFSLNETGSGSLRYHYIGGNELIEFYYDLYDSIEDAEQAIIKRVGGLLDSIFTERPVMEHDPFLSFIA